MLNSDWKMITTFGIVLGALFLLGGLIAYQYTVTYGGAIGLSIPDYPYREYAVPLFLVGVVLLVIGFVTNQRGNEELDVVEGKPTVSFCFCPSCGTKRDTDAQYCKKCGKKF